MTKAQRIAHKIGNQQRREKFLSLQAKAGLSIPDSFKLASIAALPKQLLPPSQTHIISFNQPMRCCLTCNKNQTLLRGGAMLF